MTLAHRVNTTAADQIANISAVRWDNLTEAWGGYSNTTTGPPNWGNILQTIILVYPDQVGMIAYVVIFAMPFIAMWITHADMVPAGIVGIFFALYIFAYIPAGWQSVGVILMLVGASSVIWSIWQKRG